MISSLNYFWDRTNAREYEFILAGYLTEFASDLRMVDLDFLVSCVRSEANCSLDEMVQTSSELYFKSGHLSFAWNANAKIDWHGEALISIDLEFSCPEMTVFFTLWLEGGLAAVSIKHLVSWKLMHEPPSFQQFETWISASRVAA